MDNQVHVDLLHIITNQSVNPQIDVRRLDDVEIVTLKLLTLPTTNLNAKESNVVLINVVFLVVITMGSVLTSVSVTHSR